MNEIVFAYKLSGDAPRWKSWWIRWRLELVAWLITHMLPKGSIIGVVDTNAEPPAEWDEEDHKAMDEALHEHMSRISDDKDWH